MFRKTVLTCALSALTINACSADSDPGRSDDGGASSATGGAVGSAGSGSTTAGAANHGAGSAGASASSSGAPSVAGGASGGAGSPGAGAGGTPSGGAAGNGTGGTPSAGANSGGSSGANSAGANNGGASSGGANNGGAGGGTSTSCGVTPANPKATKQAQNLLCYLYSVYGKQVLSGQQETSWSNPGNDISWYMNNGMKPPAILGGDYLYPSGTTQRAIAYWKAGGISMIRYHMGAPPQADTYENSMSSANIDNVLKEGTSENTSFKSKLDYIAGELKQLQDANAAVIWAPFHEVQAGGWFWWSKGTGPQFVALWKYMFNYLTTTKGLNNLVWLTPFSGMPNSAYYPGKAYLDISGPDTYATNQPFTGLYSQAKNVIGSSVPIPLHETGMIPDPSKMFPSAAPWVLFNIWAGYQSDGTHNTTANIKAAYADSHTVTRDEVPNLQ